MVNDCSVTCGGDELSVACMMKLKVPVPVGTPVIVPLLCSVNPGGSAPENNVKVIGGVPPETVMVCENGAPCPTLGGTIGGTTTSGAAIRIVKVCVAVCWVKRVLPT